ncbi:hypothetical protein AVL50_27365 [Flammeovirga sp. SJP92]|nr:hypothetical protein AVL50_27365 [Flammeovirga sp. SJP92]
MAIQDSIFLLKDLKYLPIEKVDRIIDLSVEYNTITAKYDSIKGRIDIEQILMIEEKFKIEIKEEYLSLENNCQKIELLYLLNSLHWVAYYDDEDFLFLLSEDGSSLNCAPVGCFYEGFESLSYEESLKLDLRLRKRELGCD